MTSPPFCPLFIVPTRNRAGLALATVQSLLAESDPRLRVWISDNSNDEAEVAQLQASMASLDDPRLRYCRPPQPLAMGSHFDWIVQQALADPQITHVSTPTDRLLFIPGQLRLLLRAAERHGERVIAYPHDHLDDIAPPMSLNQHDWTGRVVEIDSLRFLRHMQEVGWSGALPRLLNCIAPRSLLERIRAEYGNVMDSTSPDFCFGYRTLEREASFLYLDCPLIVDYALSRSNGRSAASGRQNRDYTDFLAQISASGLYPASPMPGFPGTANAGAHEYNLVREHSRHARFEPLNLAQYFKLIEKDLRDVEDAEVATTLRQTADHFRRRYEADGSLPRDRRRAAWQRTAAKLAPSYLARKIVKTLSQRWRDYSAGPWPLLRRFGIAPYAVCEQVTRWPDVASALAQARQRPLARVDARSTLEYRLQARHVDTVG